METPYRCALLGRAVIPRSTETDTTNKTPLISPDHTIALAFVV